MTTHSTGTPNVKKLMERLSSLADRVTALDAEKPDQLLDLAIEFENWTSDAKPLCGPWALTLAGQARQLVKGLQAGRPPMQGLERLLQGVIEASNKLTMSQTQSTTTAEKKRGEEVFFFDATDQIPLAPEAPSATTSYLSVKEDDKVMFRDFLQELPDHLGAVESNLLNLSRQGTWDVMRVYRPFHTLKSLFGFLGLTAMSETAHEAETLLEPYKTGQGRPTEAHMDVLLKTLDLFRVQAGLITEGLSKGRIEICPVPDLFQKSPLQPAAPLSAGLPGPTPAKQEILAEEGQDLFIRVNVARMDGLLEAMEEMTVGQTRLGEIAQAPGTPLDLREEVERLGKQSRNLQDQILSLRMVPVEPLFKRLSRMVRDLAQKTGKPVQLHLEGAGTELDKRLVDELWEPVVHLIRNALDHGLESAAVRIAAGKNAHGSLWVKAAHLGSDFVLEVADDGQGLNLSKIAEKAGRLGWLPPSGPPDPYWLEDLIFRPGFSTAKKVTDVSGRGVGLDVVKRRIQALKGLIRLENKEGKGCRFTIRIPLTLALMEGVLLRAGKGLYLLPLTQVGHFWNMQGIQALENAETSPDEKNENSFSPKSAAPTASGIVPSKKHPIRRIDLAETFGEAENPDRQPVVIQVGSEENQAYLLADEILGRKQVVLKGLSGLMEGFPSVNGAALLPDGRVSLVLDVPSLLWESRLAVAGGRT